jgi:hypothetical protein
MLVGPAVVVSLLGVCPEANAQSRRLPDEVEIRPIAALSSGSLEGVVTDDGGLPIGGAMVSALGPASVMAVADTAGRFTLRALPAGAYLVRAHSVGYTPSRRQFVEVRPALRTSVSMELRRTDNARILAAGISAAPDSRRADNAAAEAASNDDRTELAWRLRHLQRSVLKETTDRIGIATVSNLSTEDMVFGFVPEGFTAVARAVGSSARFASTAVGNLPLTGEVNLLTTGWFDTSEDIMSPGNFARGVAYLSLRGPAGPADWSVRGIMTQGQTGSWFLSSSYTARALRPHGYDVGFSYSIQRFVTARGSLAHPGSEGSRSAGAIYAADRWELSPSLSIAYGGRYSRYNYLPDGLFSPRVSATFTSSDRPLLRVTTAFVQRDLAPGAEEFLPPLAAGLWVPPERSFGPVSKERGFLVERTRHYELAIERDFRAGYMLTLRGFYQNIDNQMAALFDAARPGLAEEGHYHVGATGDVTARGVSVGVTSVLGPARGSVQYQLAHASWVTSPETAILAVWAPSAVRPRSERFHDLTTSVETEIPATATRLVVLYRLDTAFAHRAVESKEATLGARFDVQVTQPLPFLNFTSAQWQLLVAVRNMFRDPAPSASVYDELLVVRPPKRLVGGVLVRF